MASRAKEDYLKAIYECEEKNGIARTTHLADKLGVRAATVTEMVQRLSKESHCTITYKRHQGVRLTPTGRKIALDIVRRHRLLETFLHSTLKLNWAQVHEEAEVLEHSLSQRVTDAIDRHLNFPKFDPHGEPIPDKNGHIIPQTRLPLSQLSEKCRFTISRVDPVSKKFLSDLQSLGISIGATGRLMHREPVDGRLTIELEGPRSVRKILAKSITDRIFVEIQSPESI
jgi:DtxR family Mn-dependent transcriptional regulator